MAQASHQGNLALDGAPGIFSARYSGDDATDAANTDFEFLAEGPSCETANGTSTGTNRPGTTATAIRICRRHCSGRR